MKSLLALGGILLFAASLPAQSNTTPVLAAQLHWGQKVSSSIATGSEYWFQLWTVAGRSYCAEAGPFEGAVPGSGTWGDKNLDPVLDVFRSDTTTLIVQNDDTDEEPYSGHLSRACWVASAANSGPNFVRLTPFDAHVAATVTLRFSETTLFCPWFFIAGDYNAFTLLRNTSSSPLVGVVVTWRGLNGVVAGTTTVNVPANNGVVLNARTFVNPGAFSNGTIEIAHPGSPEQIQGSTTTLSGTTGLGFDAQFTQRRPW
ncbi:MAG: hypothetical protein ABI592_08500 [Acidobacteriota bacterium]